MYLFVIVWAGSMRCCMFSHNS